VPHHATDGCLTGPGALSSRWLRRVCAGLLLLALGWFGSGAQAAEVAQISLFEVVRSEEGLDINFAARFELSSGVEDALQKGVPLYFVAEATLLRERWYWRDQEVSRINRTWRLAYQPLTRTYRVSFGGLNQSFDSVADAVSAVRRISAWKLAEVNQIDPSSKYYVEFRYKLDTTLLPRPMQIGIVGQPDWTLQLERVLRLPAH